MSSEAPGGWSLRAFSEAVEINPRRTIPREGQVPFLEMAALPLDGSSVSVEGTREVSSGGAKFQAGDTLFARISPCAENGKLGFVEAVVGGATAQGSTEFIVMAAREGLTCPEYVRYLAGWSSVRDKAIGFMEGTSGRQRVPSWAFDEIEIPVPPLQEQRRIAEVLRSIDEAVRCGERVVAQEAIVRNEVVAASFRGGEGEETFESGIGPIPTHWTVELLEDVCRSVGVGIASSATHAYRDTGVPLLRNQNIKPGYLDLSDLLFVTAEYDAEYASKRVREGDVITMRTGYPGRSAVVPRKLDGCQTFTTLISKPRTERILSDFLCEWINSPIGMREVRKLQAGGAQQNLNAGALKRLPVPVPPIEDQARIVAALSSFTRSSVALEATRELRKSLAADLISGRVRVPA